MVALSHLMLDMKIYLPSPSYWIGIHPVKLKRRFSTPFPLGNSQYMYIVLPPSPRHDIRHRAIIPGATTSTYPPDKYTPHHSLLRSRRACFSSPSPLLRRPCSTLTASSSVSSTYTMLNDDVEGVTWGWGSDEVLLPQSQRHPAGGECSHAFSCTGGVGGGGGCK